MSKLQKIKKYDIDISMNLPELNEALLVSKKIKPAKKDTLIDFEISLEQCQRAGIFKNGS
ncbi:MAG: hypothetical protein ACMXYK_03540 [Candidatus Woesearchaeota archaeon]